jgi:hypothetical protein
MKFLIGPRGLYFLMLLVFTIAIFNFPQASRDNELIRSESRAGYKTYLSETNQTRVYVEGGGKSDAENAQDIFDNMLESEGYKALIAKNRASAKQLRKKWFLMIGIPWFFVSIILFYNRLINRADLLVGFILLLFFAAINL